MGGKVDLYNLGKKGVNVSLSPLHREDGTLASAQNAIPGQAEEAEAIRIRDGLVALNGSALAGTVTGLVNVALLSIIARTFYVAIDQDSTGAYQWVTSANGWSSSATATSPSAPDRTNPDASLNTRFGRRIVNTETTMYYPAEDAGGDPIIKSWDGSTDKEIARVPKNPSTAIAALYIYHMLLDGGYIYFIVHDSTTTNAMKSRVLQLEIATGALMQLGERFGADTGELGSGGVIALSLGIHQGSLYVGTGEGSKNQAAAGKIYRIRPRVDTAWTLDGTLNARENPQCLASYKGLLYAGCYFGSGAVAGRMMVRSAAGAYSQSTDTGAGHSGAQSGWYGMGVFGENLYAAAFNSDGVASTSKIYKFDNTSWTSVKTVETSANPKVGIDFKVVNGVLYVLCSEGSSGQVSFSSDGSSWTDFTTNLTTGVMGGFGLVIS